MGKNLIASVSMILLAGCATDPGDPHKIVFADANKIRFQFDQARTDIDAMATLAQQHCDKYDKRAQPIGVDAADRGLRQADFACVAGQ